MLTKLSMAAMVIAASVTVAQAGSGPSKDDTLAALEHAKVQTWRQLYRDNDVAGLDAFLSDDFVIIGANGSAQSKAEILKDMMDNPWTMPEDFLYTVTGIVFPTDGSAIVYGHGDSTRTRADGELCHHSYTSSNVFRFKDGGWHPVSSHVSDASCEPL